MVAPNGRHALACRTCGCMELRKIILEYTGEPDCGRPGEHNARAWPAIAACDAGGRGLELQMVGARRAGKTRTQTHPSLQGEVALQNLDFGPVRNSVRLLT